MSSLVKSAYQTLKSASTSHHSFIPDDFPCMILKIFQTISVSEFNEALAEDERLAQRTADKSGELCDWPDVLEITSFTTNTYSRLKATGFQKQNLFSLIWKSAYAIIHLQHPYKIVALNKLALKYQNEIVGSGISLTTNHSCQLETGSHLTKSSLIIHVQRGCRESRDLS